MVDDKDPQFEALKRSSVLQLLFKCARLANDYALERVRERFGAEGLRASHTAVFPHIDLEGTRLTTLADRLGVSKQAAGQLVDQLVSMGILERVPDPDDGRARRVRFVGGASTLSEGVRALIDVEQELLATLEPDLVAPLHAALDALERTLTGPPLPVRAYVPGHGARPTDDGAVDAAPLDPDAWRENARFMRGRQLFAAGYYWEAHEAWEDVWNASGRVGAGADVCKALIKLAAAAVKLRQGATSRVRSTADAALLLFDEASGGAPSFAGVLRDAFEAHVRFLAVDAALFEAEPSARVQRVYAGLPTLFER